ncbi:MAG: RagB/SusD family nutrient uptake outer membrane protein [Chloroflexi bacterium]|nr:RagB/SusD family nutrient uptake outer membrane protein [Chloroflexota bacterium]
MNRFLAKGLPVIALLGAVACTDLTENPYDTITEANFKPTANDVAAMLGQAYTPSRSLWMGWYGMVDWQGETSDELLTPVRPNGWDDGGIYYRNHQHRWDASSPGMPNSHWGNSYNGITAVNRLIYQIDSGLLPMDEANKKRTFAELRALRAFYYYVVMDLFGNIPIVTDFEDISLPTQSNRQQAFDFIISEINATMPDLSDAVDASTYGRMNKWAAKALLVRMYLNAQVYTGTPKWAQVIQNADEIINSGKFALGATYREVFARTNNTSKELIFATPYDETFGSGSSFHMKTLKPALRFVFNLAAQPWGGSAANPQFIDTYDVDDTRMNGVPGDAGKGGTWLTGAQWDGPRQNGYTFGKYVPAMRDQTCQGKEAMMPARELLNPPAYKVQFSDGYPVWKYEIYSGMTGASSVDFPVFRLPEIMYAKAEALIRSGQPGAGALVTQVRQRNFKNTVPAKATVTDAQLAATGSAYNFGWYDCDGVVKTAAGGTPVTNGGADVQFGRMYDEWGWEFANEALRRQTMIRFGTFTTKKWFNHDPSTSGANKTIFAIPQSRLNSNKNLVQNPGY